MRKNRLLLIGLALFLFRASVSMADIYRWEDSQGALHFTDDLSNVPAPYRDNAKVVVQEAPAGKEAAPVPTPPPAPSPSYVAPSGERGEEPRRREETGEREDLLAQVAQLRAKIAAKEDFIRGIDEKRSLALNPYRNRFVDPKDLGLYDKYQGELQGDRERLKELESRLGRPSRNPEAAGER